MTASFTLNQDAVAGYRKQQSATLAPGDAGYDEARAVWNGMIDRRPGLIVRCSSTSDVVEAVNFAREQGSPIAVRGGGHSAAGLAMCDGGVVVDLRGMRKVEVDPARRIALAQGGATWGDYDRATQAHGLASTGGAISTTGIGGLTLGGGIGYLMRSLGLACDNLIEAEVVTAGGRVVRASESENSEMLWALKGGGGNFGVVTEFVFRLHPVTDVVGGMLIHPIEAAPELIRFYREFCATAPDALTLFAGLLHSPDGMPITGVIAAYNGPVAEGEEILAPLRAYGPPVADMVAPMPYTALQTMLDEGFPSGLPVYWTAHFLRELNDEVIDKLVARYRENTSPLSALLLEQLGGAVARVDRMSTAFDHRDAQYNLAIISRWTDPATADANIAWARTTRDELAPYAAGVYVNYLGVGDAAERVRSAYGPEKYERLAAAKQEYDPANLFRYNQNIKPAG
jgi:FAD/FMN-containing dehydrogenase